MIKLSTKGRYGTRLMINLAQHYTNGNEAIILKNVSQEENVSIRYLEQIITPLNINKLAKSIRGAGGGYTLAGKPADTRLSDILHALEGTTCLVECVEDPDYCDRVSFCAAHDIWKEASRRLVDYFDKTTVQDLLDISRKKQVKTQ